jgi:hypothetical protein
MGLNRNLGNLTEVIKEGSGLIGMGLTPAPGSQYKLDVVGSVRSKYAVNGSNISLQPDSPQVYLVASSSDSTYGDKKLVINSSGLSLRAMGTSTAAMEILSSGDIGIGTISPLNKLDVAGNISLSSGGSNVFRILQSVQAAAYTGPGFYSASSIGYGVSAGGTHRWIGINGNTEVMRIDANGAVGIGVSSPPRLLTIKGISGQSNQGMEIQTPTGNRLALISGRGSSYPDDEKGYFQLSDTGTAKVALDTAGNSFFNGGSVGIGTATPAFKLHVQDGSSTYICVDNTGNGYRSIFGSTGSGTKIYSRVLSNNAAAPIAFVQGSDETVTIASNGNMLIGTQTDSGSKLQVAGRMESQNFRRKDITLQTTPQSLGLPINAYSGGGAYLLLISTQFDAGNGTGAALWMIRCGYNGNNFEATQISVSNTASGISFSQVNGILHIAGNTNWAAHIQVISNNLLF